MPATPSRSFLARARAVALAVLACAALAGCGGNEDAFAPACPGLALVPNGADLTRFNGGGQDVSNLLITGRITAVPAQCQRGDEPHTVKATLHVEASFRRGPAAGAAVAPIGYFVALMRAGRVVQEQDFTFAPGFAPNDDYASVKGDDIELVVPVSRKTSAAVYTIYVGFRLTRGELAYNQSHPRP